MNFNYLFLKIIKIIFDLSVKFIYNFQHKHRDSDDYFYIISCGYL